MPHKKNLDTVIGTMALSSVIDWGWGGGPKDLNIVSPVNKNLMHWFHFGRKAKVI